MERYAGGDDAAFGEVYDALAPRLYTYLLRLSRSTARAEDLLQQTMLKIHVARGSFIPGAAVAPWAYAIAHRLFIDSTRRGKREVQLDVEDSGPQAAHDESASADELVAAGQLAARILKELAKLPENQRVAFQLIKQEGLSVAEAAAVLGTSVAAVKLRAHRAYQALRAALGDVDGSWKEEGGEP
jgi:RNA polymerase sigma-70 factor (ECF subfamily)